MQILEFAEHAYQRNDRNWNHRQLFKATPTPRVWFDIRLCCETRTCMRRNYKMHVGTLTRFYTAKLTDSENLTDPETSWNTSWNTNSVLE